VHRHGRADRHAGRHVRRLLGERQVVRRGRRDVEGSGGGGAEAGVRGGQRVAEPRLGDGRRAEAAHPGDGRRRQRTAERAAARLVVPLRVPPAGLAPMATVTFEVSVFSRLPKRSSTCTVSAGLMATPATVVVGWAAKATWSAAAGVMANGFVLAAPYGPSR